jgi:hypothetical protein
MSDAPEQTWAVTEPDDSNIDQFSPYHDGSMQFDKDGGWVSYDDYKEAADRIEELEAKLSKSEALLAKALEAGVDVAASLTSAISLLEAGGKAAAASDIMFFQMLADYTTSLDRFLTTLAELKGPDHVRR